MTSQANNKSISERKKKKRFFFTIFSPFSLLPTRHDGGDATAHRLYCKIMENCVYF